MENSVEKEITYSTDPKKLETIKKILLIQIKESRMKVNEMTDDEYFKYAYMNYLVNVDLREKQLKYKSVL